MNLEQIIARMKEIQEELKKDGADVDALRKEFDGLKETRTSLEGDLQKRKALLDDIAGQNLGVTVRAFNKEDKEAPNAERVIESELYKRAFLKDMLGYEMDAEERNSFDMVQRAFVHTTENTGAVIPKDLQNKIYSTMEEQHPILKDVQILRTGTVMSFVKHTAIVAGDAKNVAEAEANVDEQNTFVNVTISGQDISKHVDYSYRLGKMAIPAFEAYLVKEIGDRIASQWAKNIIAQIKKDLHADNKFSAKTSGSLVLSDITKALSKLKAVSKINIYMNSATLWGMVAPLEGAEGRTAFIPNYTDNLSGTILGSGVKMEDALGEGEVLFLDPKQYIENVVQDLLIERDKDIKKHVHTISGIVISGGTMLNDKAGALLTVGTAV